MKKSQSGQIMLLAIVVAGLVLVNTLLIAGGALVFSQNSHYTVYSSQATNLAEAGLDKAVASLNSSGGNYVGDSEIKLDSGSLSIQVTDLDASSKMVTSTAYSPSKQNPQTKKTVSVKVSKGVGASFNYGIQVGEGGLDLGTGTIFNGSIYSNGNIVGGNLTDFRGDVYVAGGVQPSADQTSDCQDPSCQDFLFGKNIGGNNKLDIAQSFKPTNTQIINKVALKLKKYGNPSNLTIRLLGNQDGHPDKYNVLASGILSSSLVTNQYGFIEVAFTTTPMLINNTTYWILADTPLDNNNYWSWSTDSLQGYLEGSAVWSDNWQASNPVWNNITGDLGFKTYMGGIATSLDLGNGSTVTGNAHVNTIKNTTISGDAYYQLLVNSTVRGTSHPASVDPPPLVFPISDANISKWKQQAQDLSVFVGDKNFPTGCNTTLGPGKFIGNVILGNGCTVTVKTPIWITGEITTGNQSKFKLDSSFGTSSGMMIVDGKSNLANGFDMLGSGSGSSYLMLLSTYDSRSSGISAVTFGNSTFSGVIFAPFGKVDLANGASFKEISAWKLSLGNSAILNYETGLSSIFFTSGPSGAFSIVKGTYQIK